MFSRGLIHAAAKKPGCDTEGDHCDEGKRPKLVDEQVKRGAFKKDAAYDHHEIAHGIDQGQFLNDGRHVENGVSETGKNDAGNQKHERPQQPLLLGADIVMHSSTPEMA